MNLTKRILQKSGLSLPESPLQFTGAVTIVLLKKTEPEKRFKLYLHRFATGLSFTTGFVQFVLFI